MAPTAACHSRNVNVLVLDFSSADLAGIVEENCPGKV
jgi:hypothetical protein